jgi:hypothetical protein
MKIKFWYCIHNQGDGSYGLTIHKTETEAQESWDEDMESYGEAVDEGVGYRILETSDGYEVG